MAGMMRYVVLFASVATAAACSSSSAPSSQTASTEDAGGSASGWDENAAVPDGGDTWVGWEQGFFAKYCVECHSANDPTMRDYTKQADVVRDKDAIRCGIATEQPPAWGCGTFPPPRQFPISDDAGTNPKPTDAERSRIVDWIDAGCP
jgi:hypothetical protein